MVGGKRPLFFAQRDEPRDGKKVKGKSSRWSDIYQQLIEHGHDPDRIGRYTRRQILLYYRAACRAENRQRSQAVVDLNKAFCGGKAAENYIKKLSSAD